VSAHRSICVVASTAQSFGRTLARSIIWWNNRRNRALDDVLVVRLTTSPKPTLSTIVDMVAADAPLVGRVLCDDIEALYKDEITREIGALSVGTIRRVDSGLAAALSLALQ
jgi:mRNA interferase MazF